MLGNNVHVVQDLRSAVGELLIIPILEVVSGKLS